MKKVGLLGYGTVGKGAYKILQERKEEIKTWVGEDVEVGKVLMLPEEAENTDLPKDIVSTDFDEILMDESIDLVVEVTGAKKAGYEFMKKALECGKHVVTANKAVVSAHYGELVNLSLKNNVAFLFEAAVGGGIPVITPLKTQVILNDIHKIHGILNGTCNYLLWDMFKNNKDYESTLKKCQELGYAEADPTDDVGGFDTQRKLKILTSMVLGADVPEDNVYVEGLQNISGVDVQVLKDKEMTVKLLGTSEISKDSYTAMVEPTILSKDAFLGQIPEAINSVEIHGNFVGRLQFVGAGAGMDPTGNAIVNDIIDAFSNRYGTLQASECQLKNKNDEVKGKYYLRFQGEVPEDWVDQKDEVKGETILFTKELPRKEVFAFVENQRKEGKSIFFAKMMD
ncbi:MAG: homoserine dehydrogenase [Tissierellia bacterium]|nr:homoserine dehydrogenase [Tissierellia bacterium]